MVEPDEYGNKWRVCNEKKDRSLSLLRDVSESGDSFNGINTT